MKVVSKNSLKKTKRKQAVPNSVRNQRRMQGVGYLVIGVVAFLSFGSIILVLLKNSGRDANKIEAIVILSLILVIGEVLCYLGWRKRGNKKKRK